MTTTIELCFHLDKKGVILRDTKLTEASTRLRELDAQVTDLELKLLTERGAKAWKDVPNATAFVEELRGNTDKPDCIFTMCSDDSPTPNTLESSCDGAVLWYMGNPGENKLPKFCWHCGGAVKEFT